MSYVYLSTFGKSEIDQFETLATKAGAALVKSANATREFFAMFPAAVGNVQETQALCAMLPGMGDFADLKKDGKAFKQTFAGLDNALRKGIAEVKGGWVLWKGNRYNHKFSLFAIALCEAARKQAAKKTDGATATAKKTSREDLATLIGDIFALAEEHEINKDKRFKKLLDRWLDMVV